MYLHLTVSVNIFSVTYIHINTIGRGGKGEHKFPAIIFLWQYVHMHYCRTQDDRVCLSIAQMTRFIGATNRPLELVQRTKRVIRILYFYIRIYTLRFIRCIVIYMTVGKSKDLSQGSIVFVRKLNSHLRCERRRFLSQRCKICLLFKFRRQF